MRIRQSGNQLSIAAPAKLNLYLELLGKRDDGFHELETVMTTVSLYDQLSFSLCSEFESTLEVQALGVARAAEIPTGPDNLVLAALQQLRDWAAANRPHINLPGIRVRLIKRIPSAAGLGGASSNSVAALLAGNRLWKLGLKRDQLAELAANLGSDVPFFLYGGMALCRGRGEIIEPKLHRCDWQFVIVKPQVGLPTSEMFAKVSFETPQSADAAMMLAGLASRNKRRVANNLFNRFGAVASAIAEELNEVAARFDRLACVGHQLSGSGSSYFGIFDNRRQAVAAAAILQAQLPSMGVFTVSGTPAVRASQLETAA